MLSKNPNFDFLGNFNLPKDSFWHFEQAIPRLFPFLLNSISFLPLPPRRREWLQQGLSQISLDKVVCAQQTQIDILAILCFRLAE